MSRKLYRQIRNEWSSNIWLAIEILVVSVVLWYIIDNLYVYYKIYTKPLGFDIEHCYKLSFNEVNDKSPDYIPERTEEDVYNEQLTILDRMMHHPMVEAAALSQNSHPYNGSNSTSTVGIDSMESPRNTVRRVVTPDFMRVFRYQGTRGESPEELAKLIDEGKIITNDRLFKRYKIKGSDYIGKEFYVDDTTATAVLGATLVGPRYSDFQTWENTVFFEAEDSWITWCHEYVLRVKPEEDHDVVERLMSEAESTFHVGNKVLVNVTSFDDIRDIVLQGNRNQIRNMVVGLIFMLANIFLGLFGTFWFRTQQRVSEIAIRKAMGATNWDIFRRLVSEGLLLLITITPIAIGIDCLLAHFEFNTYYDGGYLQAGRIAICAGLSFLFIALMIIVGIWFPASRAEKIDPAVALKDE